MKSALHGYFLLHFPLLFLFSGGPLSDFFPGMEMTKSGRTWLEFIDCFTSFTLDTIEGLLTAGIGQKTASKSALRYYFLFHFLPFFLPTTASSNSKETTPRSEVCFAGFTWDTKVRGWARGWRWSENNHEINSPLLFSPLFFVFSGQQLSGKILTTEGISNGRSGFCCVGGTLSSKPIVLGGAGYVTPTRGIHPFSLLWTSSITTLHGQTAKTSLGAFTTIVMVLFSQVI